MIEWIFLITVPILAILAEGLFRKLVARMQNRLGPPILQPLYDLQKLWGKEPLSLENDVFFNFAPLMYFLSHFALFLFIPFSIISFQFDFLLLVYITILGSAFFILAGISSDSPYGIIASMREMILMICYEITLALVIITTFIFSGAMSLSGFDLTFGFLSLPLAAFCLLAVSLVELHITPFDTASAKAEILSGVETEYIGRRLFFMEFTEYLKKLFYVLLFPFLFIGTGNWLLFAAVALLILFAFSLSLVSSPRYRVDQAFDKLLIIMIIALIEFIRISWGLTWAF